ncbi:MAG: 3-phosphoshikimate 1-carboxyvinyltransferase, partial [Luteibaculum sp.]
MQERPIGDLVDALLQLGASVKYLGKEGFPPLQISGVKKVETEEIEINAEKSSQYVSAVMLAASSLKKGLRIRIKNLKGSLPYIKLTAAIMQEAGIAVTFSENLIEIKPSQFDDRKFLPEADWSAASYWYSIVAISGQEFELLGLKENSGQGDAALINIFRQLEIDTQFTDQGIIIKPNGKKPKRFAYNFRNQPDLAQTLVVCCAVLGIAGEFSGLESLRIKETDRIAALQNELNKFGWTLTSADDEHWKLEQKGSIQENIEIETYEDHRMAMAFAPWVLSTGMLYIRNAEVVEKSYPEFWKDLSKSGIRVNELAHEWK